MKSSAGRGAACPEEHASLSTSPPFKPSKDRQSSASPGEGGDRSGSVPLRTASDGKGSVAQAGVVANKRDKGTREFKGTGMDGAKGNAASTAASIPPEGAEESVSAMLKRIGLPQYTSLLESNDVDDSNWHFLDQQALEALGVESWGHRVAIWRAATQRRQVEEEEDAGLAADGVARGRKKGADKEGSRGSGDVGNKHDDLKYVYEQMENIKMHFEAQIEQLNRELHATKNELANVKRSVATGVGGGGQVPVSGNKQAARFGDVDMSVAGNSGGKDGGKAGTQGTGGGGGGGGGSRGGKTQRRKENDDGYSHGGGGPGQYMRGGATGGAYGHNNQQGYNQNQMGFSPHMYQGMMHPGNAPMHYYYNNVGMHMQGGGYEPYDQGSSQYYMMNQNSHGGADGAFPGGSMGYGAAVGGGQPQQQAQQAMPLQSASSSGESAQPGKEETPDVQPSNASS